MKRNMGSLDRGIRLILGLVIVAIGIAAHSWWGAIGVLFLVTAAAGRCPAYMPFGWRYPRPVCTFPAGADFISNRTAPIPSTPRP